MVNVCILKFCSNKRHADINPPQNPPPALHLNTYAVILVNSAADFNPLLQVSLQGMMQCAGNAVAKHSHAAGSGLVETRHWVLTCLPHHTWCPVTLALPQSQSGRERHILNQFRSRGRKKDTVNCLPRVMG